MTTQPEATPVPGLVLGFGDRMRRLRIGLGMNQDQFGDAIDLSGATVGKYELEGRTPRIGKVVASSVQLRFGRKYPGLDLKHWLLTGEQRPRNPESTVSGVHLYAVAA
jgi:transcriptional regulator with XRE-family HTH domain